MNEEYCTWKEYFTWEIRRKINLNAQLHTETQEIVDRAVNRLVNELRDYINNVVPADSTGLTDGIIEAALQEVDWKEVVRGLLDDYFFFELKNPAAPLVSEEDLLAWKVNNQ